MKNTNRRFALPYNGEDPTVFLKRAEEYRENIDSIYMSLPEVRSHLTSYVKNERGEDYEDCCARMLEESKGSGFLRFVTVNSCYDQYSDEQLREILENIKYQILIYDIDGVVSADYFIAKALRNTFKDLLIDTSCNTNQHEMSKALNWEHEIGIHAFNPPRSGVRNLELLKKYKKHGFKTKVLINEPCVVGCPYEINHYVATALRVFDKRYNCSHGDRKNMFRRCIAMPRWLDILDEYIDIYKLAGRYYPTDRIFRQMEIFINGEDCDYRELFETYLKDPLFKGDPIHTRDIPDKLLYCNGEECFSGCKVCDNLVARYFNVPEKAV